MPVVYSGGITILELPEDRRDPKMRSVSNFLFPTHKPYSRISQDNGSMCQDAVPEIQRGLSNRAYNTAWITGQKTWLVFLVVIFTTFILTFLSLVWKGVMQLHRTPSSQSMLLRLLL